MLSIAKVVVMMAAYYLSLAREDYYVKGEGERPGTWLGRFAEKLGLSGEIRKEDLQALFAGKSPQGRSLVQQWLAGNRSRIAAIDLTFSAPGSVSVLRAVGPPEVRRIVDRCHDRAVRSVLRHVEADVASTRRGKGGAVSERCRLAFALFRHETSRAQDCNLHTHGLLINVGLRADGTTGAVDARPLYLSKMALGALYRAELARLLQQHLGVRIRRVQTWFEVEGVPQQVIDGSSKRRAEIVQEMRRQGVSGAKAAERIAKETRPKKRAVPRAELYERWRREAEELGFGQRQVADLLHVQRQRADGAIRHHANQLARRVLKEFVRSRSHFTRADLLRRMAEEAQGCGLGTKAALAITDRLCRSKHLVRLGERHGIATYTTHKTLLQEQELLRRVRRSLTEESHTVPGERLLAVMPSLSAAQRRAVEALTARRGAVQCLVTDASGDAAVLTAARRIWQDAGLHVVGLSPSSGSVRELQERSGIVSAALPTWLRQIHPGPTEAAKHHLRQLGRAARRRPTWRLRPSGGLTSRTVVVLDCAQAVATPDLLQVIREVQRAGSKLVLSGDPASVQAVGPGGAFHGLMRRLGAVVLREDQQRPSWERRALESLREGDPRGAFSELALHNRLHVRETRTAARWALLRAWEHDAADLDSKRIIAGTTADAAKLNLAAQRVRQERGEVGRVRGLKFGDQRVFRGERIVFGRRSSLLGVASGDCGTVESVGIDSVTVRLDRRRGVLGPAVRVAVNPRRYPHLALAYAATVRQFVPADLKKAFVLTNERVQDSELTLAQLARASKTHIFTTAGEAGDDVAALAAAIRSRRKQLAHDHRYELQQEQRRQSQVQGVR